MNQIENMSPIEQIKFLLDRLDSAEKALINVTKAYDAALLDLGRSESLSINRALDHFRQYNPAILEAPQPVKPHQDQASDGQS